MPRGRHRHSQPLHRRLPPVSVAVAALACAGGAWLIGEPGVADGETVALRALTAAAATAAVTGAILLRRWDRAAGKQVGGLKAQLASAAWRTEEKHAELESEAEELRATRGKLAGQLREKRAELARLRSEHADLLRRYAKAETERASALEGRRLLELEAGGTPLARALTTTATDHRHSSGAPTPLTYRQANEALDALARSAVRQRAQERLRGSTAAAVVPPQTRPEARRDGRKDTPEPTRPHGPESAAAQLSAARSSAAKHSAPKPEADGTDATKTDADKTCADKPESAEPDAPKSAAGERDGSRSAAGSFDFFGRSKRKARSSS